MEHPDPVRQQLAGELAETRRHFHALVLSIPKGDLDRSLPGTAETLRSELYQVAQALQFIPFAVARARFGGGFSLLYLIPPAGRGWLNRRLIVPLLAARATHASLLALFDRGYRMVLEDLETVRPDEWERGASFGPGRYETLAQVFHRPAERLAQAQARIGQIYPGPVG